jgi:hypothetical protein
MSDITIDCTIGAREPPAKPCSTIAPSNVSLPLLDL